MAEQKREPPTLGAEEEAALAKRKFYTQLGLVWLFILWMLGAGYFRLGDWALVAGVGLIGLMLLIKCPRCEKRMMVYKAVIQPRPQCPYCHWPDSKPPP